ncbi:MAG: glycosyltransferase family 4 protein [Desulfobulbaceae bacterium]|nr:glycosyltransferase family 4 protein [Desulfobulbaceae bacterium]
MKIIYLHQYYTDPSMSGGTRSYEMARRLVMNGHEVHFITSWRSDTPHKNWFVTEESGFTVHWLPVSYSNHMNFNQRLKAFLHYAVKAGPRARQIGGDVIFATSTPLTIAIPGVFASQKLNVPMVFEVRDLWPEIPIAFGILKNPLFVFASRWLERYAYRHAERIIALSPGMKEGVVNAGYPADRIKVIPNGADLYSFGPDKRDSSRFFADKPELINKRLIVYGGTFGLINGVSYAVEMATHLANIAPDVAVVLVGDGVEKEKVTNLAKQKNLLNHNVFIYPQVSKSEMPHLLASADIALSLFVNLEAMWSNSANKFFDGLASGTAIAINYGGWQAELLQKEECGIVLSAFDHERAATQISDFLSNEIRLKSAAVSARALAAKSFSRDLLAVEFETVLNEAIKGNRKNDKTIN